MANIRGSFIVKALAFLLLTAFILVFAAAFCGTLYTMNWPEVGAVDTYFETENCRYKLSNAALNIENRLEHMNMADLRTAWIYEQQQWLGDVHYLVLADSGELLGQSYNATDIEHAGHIHTRTLEDYTIKTYVDRDVDYKLSGIGLNKLMFDFCKGFAGWFSVTMLLSALAAIFLLLFLCFAAGRRRGQEGITANLIDKIPYDLYAAVCFMMAVFAIIAIEELSYGFQYEQRVVLALAVIAGCYILAMSFIMTTITRVKLGAFWKNTLVWRIGGKAIRWCWKWVKIFWSKFVGLFGALFGNAGELIHGLPFIWKGAMVIVGAVMVNTFMGLFLMLVGRYNSIPLLLFIIIEIGVMVVCWKIMLDMYRLKKAGQYLAEGDTEFAVDTSGMLWDFRKHGENLNSIAQGISRAVDKQIRSERMKTELITNVSHDIKTPLTSIVNYVDLLKKEALEGQAAEYVDVLSRQSARLKKLTEDLVEASKASTGNMTVNLSRTNVGEIARQAAGEYSERLEKAKLDLVMNIPEPAPHIMADGRLLWRIMDNLLSNVCKYSQTGTRVYFDIRRTQGKVSIAVKNISREMLNIDPDELTERFVRGDLSRNTEGSGLGLNIARSLTELQNGSFGLTVDGDLFKAEMQFNEIG